MPTVSFRLLPFSVSRMCQSPPSFLRRPAVPRDMHSVVRMPNGNDYGKDLLRQPYQQHRH